MAITSPNRLSPQLNTHRAIEHSSNEYDNSGEFNGIEAIEVRAFHDLSHAHLDPVSLADLRDQRILLEEARRGDHPICNEYVASQQDEASQSSDKTSIAMSVDEAEARQYWIEDEVDVYVEHVLPELDNQDPKYNAQQRQRGELRKALLEKDRRFEQRAKRLAKQEEHSRRDSEEPYQPRHRSSLYQRNERGSGISLFDKTDSSEDSSNEESKQATEPTDLFKEKIATLKKELRKLGVDESRLSLANSINGSGSLFEGTLDSEKPVDKENRKLLFGPEDQLSDEDRASKQRYITNHLAGETLDDDASREEKVELVGAIKEYLSLMADQRKAEKQDSPRLKKTPRLLGSTALGAGLDRAQQWAENRWQQRGGSEEGGIGIRKNDGQRESGDSITTKLKEAASKQRDNYHARKADKAERKRNRSKEEQDELRNARVIKTIGLLTAAAVLAGPIGYALSGPDSDKSPNADPKSDRNSDATTDTSESFLTPLQEKIQAAIENLENKRNGSAEDGDKKPGQKTDERGSLSRVEMFDGSQGSRHLSTEGKAAILKELDGYEVEEGDTIWDVSESVIRRITAVNHPTKFEIDAVEDMLRKRGIGDEKGWLYTGERLNIEDQKA